MQFKTSTILFKIKLLLFILGLCNNAVSQDAIGYKYDLNNSPYLGYFDPILSEYTQSLEYNKVINTFENGYYYDSLNNRIPAQIKFTDYYLELKRENSISRIRMNENKLNGIVIGLDSFIVIKKYFIKNKIVKTPKLVQWIANFNNYSYVKHYNRINNMSQRFPVKGATSYDILYKHDDSSAWVVLDKKELYRMHAKLFSSSQFVINKIRWEIYMLPDIEKIIKTAFYYDCFYTNKKIYYNEQWQELNSINNSSYSANVISLSDSILTFEYFKDSSLLYKISYSSFVPNTKNGYSYAYYPNGHIRKKILYVDNVEKETEHFSVDNKLIYKYQRNEKSKVKILYSEINNSDGQNVISAQKSEYRFYDSILNVRQCQIFQQNQILKSYYIHDNDTIYQIVNEENKFDLNSLQNKFSSFLLKNKIANTSTSNHQGLALLLFTIGSDGHVIQVKTLNKVHADLQKIIDEFTVESFTGVSTAFKFKKFKVDNKAQKFELLIPVVFKHTRFYRRPNDFIYYNYGMPNFMTNPVMMSMPATAPRGF